MSVSVPLYCSLFVNVEGEVTVIVPSYIFILSTTQPLGIDVAVMDVIFELSNVVVPLSPGFETMMPLAGTLNEYTSLFLHAPNDRVVATATISVNV